MNFEPIIYGKYILLNRLAVGGMAEVFQAKTFGVHGFERLLVIKRILPHLTEDQEFVEMFIDEAKIAVELTHANICQVSDLGKIDSNYFIAMEYINGKDLRATLKKSFSHKKPISIPHALHIIIEALKGLDYAHNKLDGNESPLNLIHRDISPQNLMLSYNGDIKIVDFGIAKTESKIHRTQAGVLKGKFGYMSPEQASGLDLDQRTDLFSIAIILFEMLSGRRLFHSDTDFKTLEAIKNCNIPSIRKYRPEVSPELESILFKALAKDKDDRFVSAQAFQTALSKEFYNHYANFNVKDLSAYLKDLFQVEISQEQENLRRNMDTLSPELIKQATSATSADHENTSSKSINQNLTDLQTQSRMKMKSNAYPSLFQKYKKSILVASCIIFILAAYTFLKPTPSDTTVQKNNTLKPISILVSTDPSGATLYIKNKKLGQTPMRVQMLPEKVHKIQFELKGYENLEDQIFLEPGKEQLHFQLEKKAAQLHSIFIDSTPQYAKIIVNGSDSGKQTPATLHKIEHGTQLIIGLEKPGYTPKSQNIVVNQQLQEFTFNLEKLYARLKINISPSDASIKINGKNASSLIDDLESGKSYTLEFSADGYSSEKKTFTPMEELTEITIDLVKKTIPKGYLNLSAIPWANVIIDGKKLGSTPILDLTLNVGTHTITFQHPDYDDVKKKVKIKKGRNSPVIVDFR